MKDVKRFTKRVSKRRIHQISYWESYDGFFPPFVGKLLIVLGIAATIALLIYCCSLK